MFGDATTLSMAPASEVTTSCHEVPASLDRKSVPSDQANAVSVGPGVSAIWMPASFSAGDASDSHVWPPSGLRTRSDGVSATSFRAASSSFWRGSSGEAASTHWLGTESAGRDVFARMLFGARVSMSVGLAAVAIATCVGTLVGLTSGYGGGKTDNLLMRLTEFVQTFPLFFAVVILVALVGPNLFDVKAVIALLSWPGLARLVRGQVLSLRQQPTRRGRPRVGRA